MSQMQKQGIGIDIEETARFSKMDKKKDRDFLSKIYNTEEIVYCFSKKYPDQHLAGYFAAKEAVIKAMGGIGFKASISLKDISISYFKKSPIATVIAFEHFKSNISISISHTKSYAVASALVIFTS